MPPLSLCSLVGRTLQTKCHQHVVKKQDGTLANFQKRSWDHLKTILSDFGTIWGDLGTFGRDFGTPLGDLGTFLRDFATPLADFERHFETLGDHLAPLGTPTLDLSKKRGSCLCVLAALCG